MLGGRMMAISQDQFDRIVRDMPGFGRDPASVRRRIAMMEAMLAGLLVLPGTHRRVGAERLVWLIPFAGGFDLDPMGAGIVSESRAKCGPKWHQHRRWANVGSGH